MPIALVQLVCGVQFVLTVVFAVYFIGHSVIILHIFVQKSHFIQLSPHLVVEHSMSVQILFQYILRFKLCRLPFP